MKKYANSSYVPDDFDRCESFDVRMFLLFFVLETFQGQAPDGFLLLQTHALRGWTLKETEKN